MLENILNNITSIIEELLKKDDKDTLLLRNRDITFTELGLDSLNLVIFIETLSQKYTPVFLELSLVFDTKTNTVNKLADYIFKFKMTL